MVLGHVVVNLEFFSGVERTRNEEKTLQRAAKGNNENEMGKGKREKSGNKTLISYEILESILER